MMVIRSSLRTALFATLLGAPALAQAHHADDTAALASQLETLRARVEALDALKPSFAGFMPDFAERFHVLHAAGDAGDWAVAGHEIQELRARARAAIHVDATKGQMFTAMLAPGLDEIAEAVESGDRKRFGAALEQTITACNACHAATGSGFIKVTLDMDHVLNLRHSHVLSTTEPGGHGHGHGNEGGSMHGAEEAGHGHAEGEKAHQD